MTSNHHKGLGASLVLLCATTAAAGLLALLQTGALRTGALWGVAFCAVGSAIGLSLLALTFDRDVKLVVGALTVAFLLRMVLLGVGIVSSLALRGNPLAFSVAFFALYLAHQGVELATVLRRARGQRAEGRA